MPDRNYPPAYLRFLKARLSNLGRPSIWGTAIFLFVVGLVMWEYWLNPDTFTSKQDTPVVSKQPVESSSSLSQEEKAVVADIDNLPVLLNDFEQATLSVIPITPKDKTKAEKSETLEELINKQNAAASEAKPQSGTGIVNNAPAPTVKNPFVVQAENLLQSGTGDAGNLLLDVKSLSVSPESTTEATAFSNLGMGLTNKTKQNQSPVLVSPLQAALNQSANQKPSSFNNGTTTPTNTLGSLGQTSSGGTIMMPPTQSLPASTRTDYSQPTVTNQPANPYSNYNGSQTLPIAGTPTTGVSPVTSAASYPAQPTTQSITNSATPLGYANYANPDFQQPNQLPPSNPSLQQPNQLPQSNGSYPRQLRGRYNR